MADPFSFGTLGRRRLLIAAAASCLPFAGQAAGIYTPYELAQRYRQQVDQRLRLPADVIGMYAAAAEEELLDYDEAMRAPQYLLVVDSNPNVQAAFLFWRLMAGHYQLIGASPVSTASPVQAPRLEGPQGLFDQSHSAVAAHADPAEPRSLRIYDFNSRRAQLAPGSAGHSNKRLQARAADRQSAQFLGSARSDGCILLPASLIAFLDEFGVLDADAAGMVNAREGRPRLPYPGRYLLVIDSDRDERPEWSPAPEAALATAALH